MRLNISHLALTLSLALVSQSALASAPQAAPAIKEWNFLVFLNGKNNLDRFGAVNINQMETVGSNKDLNILVQWASSHNGDTRRLLVRKDADSSNVTSPVVQNLGKVDMGDWRNIVEFVRWADANYPAKHYFINVWDHGSGWHMMGARSGSDGQIHLNDISWDDETGHHITTEQLGQAMSESAKVLGHKVDIYGSDACLMAMAEVAHEMSDSVAYFVGSEETEPGAGWPYDRFLSRWRGTSTPAEVSRALVEEYLKSYQEGGGSEVTLSAFDLSKTAQLDRAIAAVGTRLAGMDAAARKKVASVIPNSQAFTYDDYVDLSDFLTQIESTGLSTEAASDLAVARGAIGDYVIANGVTDGFSRAKGVAIWVPSSISSFKELSNRYSGLQFDRATRWSSALEQILQ